MLDYFNGAESHLVSKMHQGYIDSRFFYFVKKVFDLGRTEALNYMKIKSRELADRGKINKASIPKECEYKSVSNRNEVLIECLPRESVKKQEFSNDDKIFSIKLKKIEKISEILCPDFDMVELEYTVYKHGDNFSMISKALNKTYQESILIFYLNKPKLMYMSDSLIMAIVEREWSEYDKLVFEENYRKYKRKFSKYQLIIKSEEELKIYHRYLMIKNIPSDWTREDRMIFAKGYEEYKSNWSYLAALLKNKSAKDVKQFYNVYFKHLDDEEREAEAECVVSRKSQDIVKPNVE